MQSVVTERDEVVVEPDESILEHKCAYSECQIDTSHHHEKFQIVYLVISVFILANSADQFTPFAIFLFSSPVFVDLIFFKPTCKFNYRSKIILLLISGYYTLMYFLCAGNVIIEHTDCFIVNETNLLIGWLSEYPFSKRAVSFTLVPLIAAPALNWIGSPDKKISTISDAFQSFKTDKKR